MLSNHVPRDVYVDDLVYDALVDDLLNPGPTLDLRDRIVGILCDANVWPSRVLTGRDPV